MNQLMEKFCNFSLAQSYCDDGRNFMSHISSKYGINAMPAISFAILGSLLIYRLNRWLSDSAQPKLNPVVYTRSMIIREIHSGNEVLDRLVKEDYKKALVNPATLDKAESLLKALLEEEHLDFMKIQQTTAKLEMSAKEDSAEKILREAVEKAKKTGKPLEAYEIEMLLVEMLIYKGESEKVLKCECLKDESLKDARRPLYKVHVPVLPYQAIARCMLNVGTDMAKQDWKQFIEARDPYSSTGSRPVVNFETFQSCLQRLQSAIQEVSARKGK
ncbi:uncharacterized protein LOC113852136 [Abrus precatorius]|uniref:Uncharacterized protein LOC113852136 n=1 Tax=Abrus precatorius TaxID=3816 RepID=A0A8B8K384_ABRPR|nr:uncharacterized protein LOC113852136 [Abrus precatorius]